ncbi:hypothetical protein [Pseudomonas aeruginosa]|uniref:hypothetical protein n=1 Tax=Pseudomonas aeruginosa TaxID=287 RepID=UPI00287F9B85|nr:hypothetical protein [Pseudomonas aeruginosa]
MSTTSQPKTETVAELRTALEPIRLANSHEVRREALGKARRLLGALYESDRVDADTYLDLEVEFVQANIDGARRCDAGSAPAQ